MGGMERLLPVVLRLNGACDSCLSRDRKRVAGRRVSHDCCETVGLSDRKRDGKRDGKRDRKRETFALNLNQC